jgi:4'-phosphopantetheinyl transferase EntD
VLLRELIGTDAVIPPGTDRAPVLPPTWVGSLAHDDVFAVAAVTDHADVAALGVDVEPVGRVTGDVATVVLAPGEELDATLAFVLKEAAYKAWHGLGGVPLEHHDVIVHVEAERFRATVRGGTELSGAYARVRERWLAAVVVPVGTQRPS